MTLTLLKLILLLGALQGFILGGLLATRPVNQKANRVFAILLFLLALHLTLVAFDERAFFMRFPHLSHLTWVLPLLYGPLVLMFVRRLTGIAPSAHRVEGWYFLPFTVWVVVQLPYFLQSAAAKRAYLDDFARSVADDFGLLNQLTNFVHLFFFGLAIWVYRRYRRRLPDFFSTPGKARLQWLGAFLYCALAITAFGILVFYARKYDWPLLAGVYPAHFIGVVLVIYWTAFQAMAQPALFTGDFFQEAPAAFAKESEPAAPPASRLEPEARVALADRLLHLMEGEQLYLENELTLQDLVERLDSNKQYVSEVLNNYLGKNFYDFVNDYRVEAFRRLAADPANRQFTLLALAHQAGFNSKATFNAVFKKKTGLTPSAYLKQIHS